MNQYEMDELVLDRIQFTLPRLIDAAMRDFAKSRGLAFGNLIEQGFTIDRVLELLDEAGIRPLNVVRKHVAENFVISESSEYESAEEQLFQFLRNMGFEPDNPLAKLVAEVLSQQYRKH